MGFAYIRKFCLETVAEVPFEILLVSLSERTDQYSWNLCNWTMMSISC